jgi:ABC-2 type transport system ATP-binding protein
VLLALGLEPENPDAPGGATGAVLTAALPEHIAAEKIVAALVAADVRVRGFSVNRDSLEDLFVALTGEGFDVVQ